MLESLSSIRPLAALAVLLAVAGCSERQIEPDYSEYIENSCAAACPITTECVEEPFYASTEECISMCSTAERWEELDQCDSRAVEHSLCLGELSCDEYQVYLMSTLDDEPGLPAEGTPCRETFIARHQCDSDQPFEPPE